MTSRRMDQRAFTMLIRGRGVPRLRGDDPVAEVFGPSALVIKRETQHTTRTGRNFGHVNLTTRFRPRDPRIDSLFEHIHRQRAGAEDFVVECADVELRT